MATLIVLIFIFICIGLPFVLLSDNTTTSGTYMHNKLNR